MERKFLKDLGLEDEAIDKIMDANGKDIEAHKRDAGAKATELVTAQQTIATLQATVRKFDGVDAAGLQKKIDDLQSKYDADTAQIRKDAALDLKLVQAKARNVKAARALIDDPDSFDLDALQKEHPYLFEIETKKHEGPGHEGPGSGGSKGGDADDYSAQLMQARKNNNTQEAISIKQAAAEKGIILS